MKVKVIKNMKRLSRVKELFNSITNDEIKQLISLNSLSDVVAIIEQCDLVKYDTRAVLADLLNLYFQVNINKATILINQLEKQSIFGITGLQIESDLRLKPNCDCFINSCDIKSVSCEYSNVEALRNYLELNNSNIHTLKITFDYSMYVLDIEPEIHKWINSRHTKVNEIQISYR